MCSPQVPEPANNHRWQVDLRKPCDGVLKDGRDVSLAIIVPRLNLPMHIPLDRFMNGLALQRARALKRAKFQFGGDRVPPPPGWLG
ncbi:hypothetical protein J2D73_19650 [Acetobacter sacchari]|uniref:Uncharacterized protein n=1 Tax=Acetobacter sacchari TaxID=2661687 RepID=A0ABS3M1M1_9PROT|nr:hypothetical protein [Acetobacter sacchari]MBO1362000.1 hypothetical protein [Acetobacter sacchari]